MAASNSAALAEILGIPSSSSSSTASPSPFTTTTSTSTTPTPDVHENSLQQLTTATQSVGDYFKAKLGAKAATQHTPSDADKDQDDDLPRAGLGAARLVLAEPPDEPLRAASKFAAMFANSRTTARAEEEVDGVSVERVETHEDEEDRKKRAKKQAKEERRKKKERRQKRKEEKGERGT